MNLKDILKIPGFQFPLVNTSNEPFVVFLADKLREYIRIIESNDIFSGFSNILTPKEEFVTFIKKSSDNINHILNIYNSGRQPDAYPLFAEYIKSIESFLLSQTSEIETNRAFFRARFVDNSIEGTDFTHPKYYFFHAPFEKRDRVKSTRFAFSGYPVLYLSNSLVVAYLETRSSHIAGFQAVRFQNTLPLNFLFLDYGDPSDELLNTNIQEYERLIALKGLLFPLLASCFTKVKDDSVVAPQEYIISQFLSRWNKDNVNLNGIKYCSTQIERDKYKLRFFNLILPPMSHKAHGYCDELRKLFSMSDVCNWSFEKDMIEKFFSEQYTNGTTINEDVIQIEWTVDKKICEYCKTELGKMEYFMQICKPVQKIDF